MPPTIFPAPSRARRTLAAAFLLIVALGAAGCDRSAPTAPDATDAPAGDLPAAKPVRTPTVSALQIQSDAVFVTSDGSGLVSLQVDLTNPGRKATDLYIEGVLQQGAAIAATDQTIVRCGAADGTLPHGTCTMRVDLLLSPAAFITGTGTFTLTLLKRVGNVVTSIDNMTVEVAVVRI